MNPVNLKRKHYCKSSKKTKLILCLSIIISLFSFSGNIWAQGTNNVTLSISHENLQTVLDKLEENTSYRFTYRDVELSTTKDITISASNMNIEAFLNKVLAGKGLTFRRNGNTFSILPVKQTQEDIQIKGNVVDNTGESLIGVNVVVKGTLNGSLTDINGDYTINVKPGDILSFSYIGYLTQEIKVEKNVSSLNVILQEETKVLNEVVVIGYGTQRRSEVASSIGTVKSEDFVKGVSVADASQLIKGKIAGVSVISPDANPNSTAQIMLRGITTLKANTAPLILIDGIPGSLNTVSPQDIQQIDVLKDGSAAAIYGTRGTNGVILITTRNARGEMPTVVEVNSSLAVQKIVKTLPFMNASEYRELVAAGKVGAQDYGASTSWLDEVTRTPLTQVYNISLRGGSRTTNYAVSLEYRNVEGIIKRTKNEIIYPRIEVNHRMLNDMLKLTAGVNGSKQSDFSGSDGGSYENAVYKNAIMYNPTDPIKDENGDWTEHNKTDYYNPVALLNEVEGENKATNLRTFASADFSPIKNLSLKYLASVDVYNQTRGYYRTKNHMYNKKDKRTGYASKGTTRDEETLQEITALYNNTFYRDHALSVLGGYSWTRNKHEYYYMQNYDFPSDGTLDNNMGLGLALKNGQGSMYSLKQESTLIGFFGRVNYGYRGKYNLSLSMRREGSSKFGANHKWGNFPAISAAWNMAEEDFMKDQNILTALKFRVGYGITGTAPIDPYKSLILIDFDEYTNMGESWIQTLKASNNPNPDLKWEKKKEFNIGLDFGLFNDLIYGSIDYYNRKTVDLLWDYNVPNPPYLYGTMRANVGTMRNSGIEVSLAATPIKSNDWAWNTSLNYSTNTNKLLTLSNDKFVSTGYADEGDTEEPIQMKTHRLQEGQPIGNFYGYKSVDIDDNGRWVIEGQDGKPKSIENALPEDKHIIGNGLPKHYLNWNNTVVFKNFDLNVTMRGAFGFDILNMPRMHYSVPSILTRGNVLRGTFDNIYGKRPLSDNEAPQYVSYYIEKGDYWKIDNVTLGYTLNFNSSYIKVFRVYGSISNLAVLTGYSGLDPEVSVGGLNPGIDGRNRYPSARTFTLGVSLQF